MIPLITLEQLKDRLDYSAESGAFIWKNSKTGFIRQAGTLCKEGYTQINISGRQYRAHRLAWFYIYGEWPANEVDHINGDRADNRIANLRLASRSQNQRNQKAHKDSASGLKGAFLSNGKYVSRIRINRKYVRLGTFDTAEEAHAAYMRAAAAAHGEFACSSERARNLPDQGPFARLATAAELIGSIFKEAILPERERMLLLDARKNVLAVVTSITAKEPIDAEWGSEIGFRRTV